MVSIFSTPFKVEVLPSKRYLCSVVILTIFILILNLISSIFCVLILLDSFKDCSKIILAISIIDIAITLLTLAIESIATYVSDHMVNKCINVVEKIKNNNVAMNLNSFKTDLLNDSNNKYQKLKPIEKIVKILSVFICIACIISAILSDFSTDLNFIKITALALSVISTFMSIYQTFISTVSCFISGTYTSALFNMLYDFSKEIAGKYNDVLIQS